jgi:hypothetical protein
MESYWSDRNNNYSIGKAKFEKPVGLSKTSQNEALNGISSLFSAKEDDKTVEDKNSTRLSPEELYESMKTTTNYSTVSVTEISDSALRTVTDELNKNKAVNVPYSELVDDTGMINYNSVTYTCDPQSNAICLGDMSNPEDVLTIPLSGGGCLKVNRDNIDELSKSIGMFSPEDVKRIMDALAQDAKAKKTKNEIEDAESKIGEKITKKDSEK